MGSFMLYALVKLISIAGIRTFFNRISSQNLDQIPKEGAVIFVCNHPNTMMDPLIVGSTCGRNLYFFAKSTIFNNFFTRWILNQLRVVPVYRKQDNPTQTNKNIDTFYKGYEILESGESFLIFPEGTSTGDRTLGKIKTGAARIGFGAIENNNWRLNISLVPVGLSYSNAVKFRSDVIVRYGKPIDLKSYQKEYEADKISAVQQLTEQIETALSKLTTNVNDLSFEKIVNALELIYKKELMVDLGLDIQNKTDDFSATKGLVHAVEWYCKNRPEEVEEFEGMLDRYQNRLDLLKLKDEFLDPASGSTTMAQRIRVISYIILGFPVYVYGLINNAIPYKFPRWYAKNFVRDKSVIAPTKLITGMGIFIIFYSIQIFLFAFFSGNTPLTIFYAFTLVPSGNFVLSYIHQVRNYRQHLRFLSIFYRKRIIMYELIEERQTLIQYLNNAKKAYMKIEGINPI